MNAHQEPNPAVMLPIMRRLQTDSLNTGSLSLKLTGLSCAATAAFAALTYHRERPEPQQQRLNNAMQNFYWLDGILAVITILCFATAAYAKSKVRSLEANNTPTLKL